MGSDGGSPCWENVLVIEENTFNRQMLQELLKLMGMKCSAAASVHEAAGAFNGQSFDMIMADVKTLMTECAESCGGFAGQLRKDGAPLLALAESQDKERIRKNCAAEISGFITKPYSGPQIKETLKTLACPEGERQPASKSPYGVDRDDWYRSYAHDEELFKESIALFAETSGHVPAEILRLLREGNAKVAGQAAHSFSGAVGACCMKKLHALASSIEPDLTKNGKRVEEVIKTAELLTDETAKVLDSIREYVNSGTESVTGGREDDARTELVVSELLALLDSCDVLSKNYFKEHRQAFEEYLTSAEMKTVEKCINTFDYEKAYSLLYEKQRKES